MRREVTAVSRVCRAARAARISFGDEALRREKVGSKAAASRFLIFGAEEGMAEPPAPFEARPFTAAWACLFGRLGSVLLAGGISEVDGAIATPLGKADIEIVLDNGSASQGFRCSGREPLRRV